MKVRFRKRKSITEQRERMPQDKQKSNRLDHNQSLVVSPGGAQRRNRLTDRQLQSDSTLTEISAGDNVKFNLLNCTVTNL